MDEPPDPRLTASVQDVQRAVNVDLDVARGRLIAVRNANEAGQVEDGVMPIDYPQDSGPILNIALDQANPLRD